MNFISTKCFNKISLFFIQDEEPHQRDMAIIKVVSPFRRTDFVKPIPLLPTPHSYPGGTNRIAEYKMKLIVKLPIKF